MSNQQRKQGVVVLWSKSKGFGILQCGGDSSLERYFAHTKFIRSGVAHPTPGQKATFEVSDEPIRREGDLPCAIRIDVIVDSATIAEPEVSR